MNKEVLGLSDDEVISSRAKNGDNTLEIKQRETFLRKLIKNLGDPIIRVLIIAFFVTLLFSGSNGIFEAIGIATSVLVSTFVSTLSEYGSEKAFRKMQLEAEKQSCEVIRNGSCRTVNVEELVIGDCVSVKAGDRVGADGVLIRGNVSVDMSAINGESAEQHKSADEADAEAFLYRGSAITAGKGVMRVSAVGKDTFYGKIASEVQDSGGDSPLRDKLTVLARTISRFGYFCAVCVALAYLINVFFLGGGFVYSAKNVALELLHALTLAISVVVVAVPEGLPMMITVVLSANMIRMQRQNIRVRKPVGIETSGSVDILFTDKTGTLTYGDLRAVCYVTGNGERARRSIDLTEEERFLLGMGAVHASECRIESFGSAGKRRAVTGNSSERAILNEYLECGEYPSGTERTALLPFDSKTKLCAASVSLKGNRRFSALFGENLTLMKGAPEILIKHCNSGYGRDGKRRTIKKDELEKQLSDISSKGMRVLALISTEATEEAVEKAATKLAGGETPDTFELFNNATFICFVCLKDEIRRESRSAIRTLKGAGIQTVMITGDSVATATAIAKEVGIIENLEEGLVLESFELRSMSDEIGRAHV